MKFITFFLLSALLNTGYANSSDSSTANLIYAYKTTTEENLRDFFASILSKETIDSLNRYHCLNTGDYPGIEFNDNLKIGMFTCGTSEIESVVDRLTVKGDLRTESAVKSIAEYEADFQSINIASSYDRYFPVSLFIQGKSEYPFRRVNGDAVTWLGNNLVPSPDLIINGVSAQEYYDKSVRIFFRSMKFYYDYLHNELDIDYELMLYKEMISEEDNTVAGGWLYFWYNRKSYDVDINPDVKPHQFIGFWLRRELDGSADVLHSSLIKILQTYDRNWLSSDILGESKIFTGMLIDGGGIDNYSLIIQTDENEHIDVYCQPDCGDWFESSPEHEGVRLKQSLQNKKVSVKIATEANKGRLAGPGDDEKFIFLQELVFIDK